MQQKKEYIFSKKEEKEDGWMEGRKEVRERGRKEGAKKVGDETKLE